jgi:hypothetical protein
VNHNLLALELPNPTTRGPNARRPPRAAEAALASLTGTACRCGCKMLSFRKVGESEREGLTTEL